MLRCFLFALLLTAACQSEPPRSSTAVPAAAPGRAGAPGHSLVGTHWRLTRLGTQPLPVAEPTDLTFNASATPPRCAGNAGCNRFSGTYTLAAPDGLTFGPLVSTKMACPALATETRYLAALRQTARYRVAGDSLLLFGPQGGAPLLTLRAK